MKTRTEIGRNNFYAMICHTIMDVMLVAAYSLETFAKHERGIVYFLIVMALGLTPLIIEWVCFRKNEETTMVKHCIGYGFAIFYTFLLFTATNPLTFTYVLLMIPVISIFNDKAFSIKVNTGAIILNIAHVIIGVTTGGLGYINLAAAEIQLAIVLLMAGFSIAQAAVLKGNNAEKLHTIQEQQQNTENRFNQTMDTVAEMTSNIAEMATKVETLSQTVNYTRDAMSEVSLSSSDIAEAVQAQLEQTQTIQANLSHVDTAASNLLTEMNNARALVANGAKDMETMVETVNESVSSGNDVARQLETLDEKIKEMNSIVEIINAIANKTSLLSLNASIEAARAGEAGRGFSVVAGEISAMATQTKEATVHITSLIDNVSVAITNVVAVIRNMIDGIREEKAISETTAESFAKISESTVVMAQSVQQLTDVMNQIISANSDIIDSISTISGVTEEVSAHATQTLDAEEDNATKLTEISALMTELEILTKQL